MRRILFIGGVLLVSLTTFAQKIEKSVLDEFTNKPLIATSWTDIRPKIKFDTNYFSSMYGDHFLFDVTDGVIHYHLRWYSGVNGIAKDAELLFKMSNGSIVTLRATQDFQTYREENKNLEVVYTGNFSELDNENNLIQQMRISTKHGIILLQLNEKDARKITKAYKLIKEEIAKY